MLGEEDLNEGVEGQSMMNAEGTRGHVQRDVTSSGPAGGRTENVGGGAGGEA